MKTEDYLLLSVTAGFVIYWMNEQNKRQIQYLNQRNRNLVREFNWQEQRHKQFKADIFQQINKQDNLTTEVKKQLKKLIEKYKLIDERIASELISVASLIEMKQEVKGIACLVKVIENLLKSIYCNDEKFKEKYSNKHPRLVDLLKYAKSEKLLVNEEFEFANGLRLIRNQEAHELDVQKGHNWVISSFLTSISIILKIHNFQVNILNQKQNIQWL